MKGFSYTNQFKKKFLFFPEGGKRGEKEGRGSTQISVTIHLESFFVWADTSPIKIMSSVCFRNNERKEQAWSGIKPAWKQ